MDAERLEYSAGRAENPRHGSSVRVSLGMAYTLLLIAFGRGVWQSARGSRPLRIVAAAPSLGVWDRICIASGMIWIAVLAIPLLRLETPAAARGRQDTLAA
jgi:hypothetical protein